MNGWVILSAISTVVIAVFSAVSFFLARSIKAKNDEYQNQIKDLFQTIVVSNVISVSDGIGADEIKEKLKTFKELYKGDILE
jgi:hypothetical protein